MNLKAAAVLVSAAAIIVAASLAMAADKTSIPKGFEKWEKSKARVIPDKNDLFYGIHYIYVDKKTMKTYKIGGVYPAGSRFVAVDYSIRDEGGKKVEGKKSLVVL